MLVSCLGKDNVINAMTVLNEGEGLDTDSLTAVTWQLIWLSDWRIIACMSQSIRRHEGRVLNRHGPAVRQDLIGYVLSVSERDLETRPSCGPHAHNIRVQINQDLTG